MGAGGVLLEGRIGRRVISSGGSKTTTTLPCPRATPGHGGGTVVLIGWTSTLSITNREASIGVPNVVTEVCIIGHGHQIRG